MGEGEGGGGEERTMFAGEPVVFGCMRYPADEAAVTAFVSVIIPKIVGVQAFGPVPHCLAKPPFVCTRG